MLRELCAAGAALFACVPAGAATVYYDQTFTGWELHGYTNDWRVGVNTFTLTSDAFMDPANTNPPGMTAYIEGRQYQYINGVLDYISDYSGFIGSGSFDAQAGSYSFTFEYNPHYLEGSGSTYYEYFFWPGYLEFWFTAYSPDNGGSYHLVGAYEPFATDAPVPEPATWALMVAGFGLAGAALRRMRRLVQTGRRVVA